MWILVYIYLNGMNPISVNAMGPGVAFDNMYECFEAREQLSLKVGGENGYFPNGSQAICIHINGGQT